MKTNVQRTGILLSVILFISQSLLAYNVMLNNGRIIHFEKYHVEGGKLVYVDDRGKENSVPIADINLDITRQMNLKMDPPLKVPGLSDVQTSPSAPQLAVSLGDIARQNHPKQEERTQDTQRIYTNDDFHSLQALPMASDGSKPDANFSHEKIGRSLQEAAMHTEQEFANIALGPELQNCEFPGRAAWQSRLYSARENQIVDLQLCISDRVSDNNAAQGAACSRMNADKYRVESLEEAGRGAAQAWRRRSKAVEGAP